LGQFCAVDFLRRVVGTEFLTVLPSDEQWKPRHCEYATF